MSFILQPVSKVRFKWIILIWIVLVIALLVRAGSFYQSLPPRHNGETVQFAGQIEDARRLVDVQPYTMPGRVEESLYPSVLGAGLVTVLCEYGLDRIVDVA